MTMLSQRAHDVTSTRCDPRVPLPHFDSNLAGTLASTGLRKLSRSGSITVMPACLERVDQLGFLLHDLVVLPDAVRRRRALCRLPRSLSASTCPCRLVHHDQPRRDDMPGQHEILLHLVELRALDRRQRILLPVHRALAQRQIELADIERRRPRAPGLRHRAERIDLRDAQLEALHVVDRLDRACCPT